MRTRTAERLAEILDEIISEAVEDIRVDADDVQGLDDKIDNALSEFEPETEANDIPDQMNQLIKFYNEEFVTLKRLYGVDNVSYGADNVSVKWGLINQIW